MARALGCSVKRSCPELRPDSIRGGVGIETSLDSIFLAELSILIETICFSPSNIFFAFLVTHRMFEGCRKYTAKSCQKSNYDVSFAAITYPGH